MDILLEAWKFFWGLMAEFGEEIIRAVFYTSCGVTFVALTKNITPAKLLLGNELKLARLVLAISMGVAIFHFMKEWYKNSL